MQIILQTLPAQQPSRQALKSGRLLSWLLPAGSHKSCRLLKPREEVSNHQTLGTTVMAAALWCSSHKLQLARPNGSEVSAA